METLAEVKIIGYDVDGHDIISDALNSLLNGFPGIRDDIFFAELDADGGTVFYPISGAAIFAERESVTGHVTQTCQYPFEVLTRGAPNSEGQKITIKERLDTLGRWLERQPVIIGEDTYKLEAYPTLSQGRKITKIARSTPAYCRSTNDNGVEDWAISINLQYTTEFER